MYSRFLASADRVLKNLGREDTQNYLREVMNFANGQTGGDLNAMQRELKQFGAQLEVALDTKTVKDDSIMQSEVGELKRRTEVLELSLVQQKMRALKSLVEQVHENLEMDDEEILELLGDVDPQTMDFDAIVAEAGWLERSAAATGDLDDPGMNDLWVAMRTVRETALDMKALVTSVSEAVTE